MSTHAHFQASRHFELDPLITDDPARGWRRLAAAVVLSGMQAARGLKDLQAVYFLEVEGSTGGWTDLAEVDRTRLFDFIAAGCPRISTARRSPGQATGSPRRRRMAQDGTK